MINEFIQFFILTSYKFIHPPLLVPKTIYIYTQTDRQHTHTRGGAKVVVHSVFGGQTRIMTFEEGVVVVLCKFVVDLLEIDTVEEGFQGFLWGDNIEKNIL
jgi:hypothetical protein